MLLGEQGLIFSFASERQCVKSPFLSLDGLSKKFVVFKAGHFPPPQTNCLRHIAAGWEGEDYRFKSRSPYSLRLRLVEAV